MKIYTIIGGVNGVGKSNFIGVLKERITDLGVIVDVDKITAELGGNALAGGKAALRKISECIDKGVSFTQEPPCQAIRRKQRRNRSRIWATM